MGLYRRRWKDKGGKIHQGKTWDICYMVPGEGQKCESTGTSNKRLAQKILDTRRAEIAEGRYVNLLKSQTPTLTEWLARYLVAQTSLSLSTRRRYDCSRRNLERFFDNSRVSTITEARIEEYKRDRLAAGMRAAGINRDLSLLRLALKKAKRERYIASNPVDDPQLFMNERKERLQAKPFTLEEEQRLLSVAKGYLRLLILLLVDTGLRVGKEALPLPWSAVDVDSENPMIYVRVSKTLAGIRSIPLTRRLKEELLRWRQLTGPRFSEFVFFYPVNPTKHLQQVPKSWARALREAGVEPRRIYDLRATFATRLNAAGVPQVFVDQLMGHSGGLAQTYAKVDEFKRSAIGNLETFILSKTPTSTPPVTSGYVN